MDLSSRERERSDELAGGGDDSHVVSSDQALNIRRERSNPAVGEKVTVLIFLGLFVAWKLCSPNSMS